MPKQTFPEGSTVVLYRRLVLPSYPIAEAGPAAVAHRWRSSWFEVGMRAAHFNGGSESSGEIGIVDGVGQRVLVLSPVVPSERMARIFSVFSPFPTFPNWDEWRGGKLPQTDADVIIVWLPLLVLTGFSVLEAAQKLVDRAFGGGAVYDAKELTASLAEHDSKAARHE